MKNNLTVPECFQNENDYVYFLNRKDLYKYQKSKYPYKSIGFIIEHLKVLGYLHYDTAIIHNDKIDAFGKTVATYTYDEELQFPLFNIIDVDLNYYNLINNALYIGVKNNL